MKHDRLENMVKGWFAGAFEPAALKTNACEVAVKKYFAGDSEGGHYHKIATEVTMVLSGKVKMFGKVWTDGDIVTILPGEITAFEALTDAVTVVLKVPGVLNDKYEI
jgi:hypothetical protein